MTQTRPVTRLVTLRNQPAKDLFTLSPDAAGRIRAMLDARGKPSLGIRVGVRTRGCSGLAYTLEFADIHQPHDEIVESEGIKIFIDPKAVLFVVGTTMEYKDEKVAKGFVFTNPNEKGRCGCGESFHV